MFSLTLGLLVAVSQSAPPSPVVESTVVSVRDAFQTRPPRNPDSVLVAPTPALLDAFHGGARRLRMSLPAGLGEGRELELERFEVTAPGARFLIVGDSGEIETAAPNVTLYRGRVAGDPHSSAFLAVAESRVIMGRVERHGSPSIAISAASQGAVAAGAVDDWVFKRSDGPGATPDLVPPCGVTQAHRRTVAPENVTAGVTVAHGPQFSTLAIEGDQSFTQLFPDVPSAQAYVVALIGAINEIYQRDLDMKLVIDRVRLWPSGGMPFGADNLSGFANYWVANEPTAGINQVHLLSGRRDLSYGGVAYVGGFCGGPTFGISGFLLGGFPSPVEGPDLGNWDVIVSAHEMGHNLGTFHTHDGYTPPIDECGSANLWAQGEIMSYCHTLQGGTLNIDMRFSTRIQDVIADEVLFEGCLPFDCNGNNISDTTDIALGAPDVNFNGIPDVCEDCDSDTILDSVEIAGGAPDVDGNGIPDACEPDCNANGLPDEHDTALGFSPDVNANRVPDTCEPDCDNDLTPDFAEIAAIGSLADIDRNQIPDACEDCNGNGQPDWADLGRPGFIYIADQGSDTVRVYHARSGVLEATLGAGLLADPYDLTFDDWADDLYVSSFSNDSVYHFDPDTGAASLILSPFSSTTIDGPAGLAMSDYETLFVASQLENRVLGFRLFPFVSLVTLIPPGTGGLVGPRDLEFDFLNGLFVGTSNDAILAFREFDGTILGEVVHPGEGGLAGLRQFALAEFQEWIAATSGIGNEVLRYDWSNGFLGRFNDEYPLTTPTAVAFGLNWNVFVARAGLQPIRVIEYDGTTGRYLRSFIRGDFDLTAPSAIMVRRSNMGVPRLEDCNANGRPDDCDISSGESLDTDLDNFPDDCQQPIPYVDWENGKALRSFRMSLVGTYGETAPTIEAIRVRMVDLQAPTPGNPPCCPPTDFSSFESPTCSAPGESAGCSRWVGRPTIVLESQDNPALGSFKVSRLQCTPFYHDWTLEGYFRVMGSEIMPSSRYDVSIYPQECQGVEENCPWVWLTVAALTRRAGDVAEPFNPPSTSLQPDSLDVVAVVNKFRNQLGAPSKTVAQVQPNVIDLNADVSALDIVAAIDNFRGFAYPFSGPCPCPSTVACGATACSTASDCSGGTCVHVCDGGSNGGLPCNNDSHCNHCVGGTLDGLPCHPPMLNACPGGLCTSDGACGPGFCRDRCGRCRD